MPTAQLGALLRHIHLLAAGDAVRGRTDRELLDDFAAGRNESAFAALVGRHGPMVLRVCRRVLGHEHDAEDAFQASFLVLARKARSIRQRDTIASWLHGVAYRIALSAKRTAARRRKHENQARDVAPTSAVSPTWDDVQSVLDEEIQRLRQRFREAFVLCVLEGKSGTEAATALGCKEGTVKSRVSRARQMLQQRLSRRGIELTALLAALSVAESAGRAALSVPLAHAAVRCGLSVAAAKGTAATIPAHVAALAAGVIRAMFLSKAKMVVVCLFAVGLAATGAGVLIRHAVFADPVEVGVITVLEPTRNQPAKALDQGPTAGKREEETVRGRVVDPDGRPVRDAKLLLMHGWWDPKGPRKVWGTSGSDGRFEVHRPRQDDYDSEVDSNWQSTFIVATAPGFGFGVASLNPKKTATDVELRLTRDIPIQGRVLDLQGRPISAVRVRIKGKEPYWRAPLYVPKSGDLTDWLTALKAGKKDPWEAERAYFASICGSALDLIAPPVETGADGRFELRGIGAERLVYLRLDGETIATQLVSVATRTMEKVRLPLSRRSPKRTITYHGASFEIVVGPTRAVVGVVRDKDTRKPLAGVSVAPNKMSNPYGISNYNANLIKTVTDSEGRYRLVGLPIGEDNQLVATADKLPYLPLGRKVARHDLRCFGCQKPDIRAHGGTGVVRASPPGQLGKHRGYCPRLGLNRSLRGRGRSR